MSKLSRAVKFVIVIWLSALCLAVPQAIQFGVVYEYNNNGSAIVDSARCSMKWVLIEHAFEISTMLFFVVPMTLITVLYVLIAIKLRRSRLMTTIVKSNHMPAGLNHCDSGRGKNAAQRNVIRMLVAVVVAFFICWAPFHAQRLLAVYAQSTKAEPEDALIIVYTILTYVSGVFYYLSTTVNPLLYNIMSNKFREAFKSMLSNHCRRMWSSQKSIPRQPTYSSLSRYTRSITRQADDFQNSRSSPVSVDHQRLTNVPRTTNSSNPNEVMPLKDQHSRPIPKVNRISCREYERSISRGSNSSQLTLMTSINKSVNEDNNNVAVACAGECLLKISRPPRADTFGYADTNYANDEDDNRWFRPSTRRDNGRWQTRKQRSVALSSTEAEYMALSNAAKDDVYLKKLFKELTGRDGQPITLFSDSPRGQKIVMN